MVVAAAATSVWSLCGSAAFADADASGQTTDSSGVLAGNNVQVPVHLPLNACGNSVDVVGVLNPAFGTSCANESGSDDSSSGASASSSTEGSSGVLSGNTVQIPVHAPVNACGNSVDVIGVLNGAADNDCSNGSGSDSDDSSSGASASSSTSGSSGVLAGNTVQVPVHAPVNLCGNTVDVIGVLNPAADSDCAADSTPDVPEEPPANPPTTTPPTTTPPTTTPPTTTPPTTTPPVVTPPVVTPPVVTPPAVTPPAVTPPASTPPASTVTPQGPSTVVPKPDQLAETGAGETALAAGASAALLLGGALLYRRGRSSARV